MKINLYTRCSERKWLNKKQQFYHKKHLELSEYDVEVRAEADFFFSGLVCAIIHINTHFTFQ